MSVAAMIFKAQLAARGVPVVVGVRHHFNDGSVAFFAYACRPCGGEAAVCDVIRGRVRAAELRFSNGSLVIVRPKGKAP